MTHTLERESLLRILALERSQKSAEDIKASINRIDDAYNELKHAVANPINPFEHVFIEPGTGLLMNRGKFYIISDSGSSYAQTGFSNVDEARVYMKGARVEYDLDEDEIVAPVYDPVSAWPDMDACNILCADDLLDFWIRTDFAYLLEVNNTKS